MEITPKWKVALCDLQTNALVYHTISQHQYFIMNRFDRENAIQDALRQYYNDVDQNLSKIASSTGLPMTTLWNRVNGTQTKLHQRSHHARLTDSQERVLAQHILHVQLQYRPINYAELRVFANLLAKENCPPSQMFTPLGKHWIQRFLERHPELRSRKEQQLEIDRVAASQAEVEDQNTWNGDEVGARHNPCQSEAAVINKLQGVHILVTSSKTKWTTIMKCVSATGLVIRPLVIH